jgi:AraC family transcriptional activator of pobA
VQCALQDRVLGLGQGMAERLWRAVLLTSGRGSVTTGEEVVPLIAPCLAWIPWRPDRTLKIHAGGVGYQFSVDGEALVGAIGNNPESVDLRYLVDRRIVAAIENDPETIADAENAFDAIMRELHRPRSGSLTMVQALLCAVRFRQLVEMHFRDRWQIGSYAEAIGISPDRLHDICRRKLGKTPSQLIQERVVHEARLRLERSALTVEQVANSLGFRDVGHFSRFFKSKAGLPPATYRHRMALSVGDDPEVPVSTYADWP